MVIPQTELVASIDGREIYRATLPPGDYIIGREQDAQIRLDSNRVSRRHGQLTLTYYDWMIEDFGSANGTIVGTKPVREATLIFPRQEVRVGNVLLELRRLPITETDEALLAPQTVAVQRYLPEEMRGTRKFKVLGIIALGGMGAVLEVEDVATRRHVAMKVLLHIRTPEDVARFVEEAQVTAQLEHPNIVPVYEMNVNELDKPFYTMKLVRGDSLEAVLSGLRASQPAMLDRYTLEDLLVIFHRVADGIAFAHSKGVVHRDLKPDNIMLGEFGETVVLDWGLAKPVVRKAGSGQGPATIRTVVSSSRQESSTHMTQVGLALGTPQYMSPEQASGESHGVDFRADIYGLGALLYSILTLLPPVPRGDPIEVLIQVVSGRIIPPADAVRNEPPPHLPGGKIPQELNDIVMKAMAVSPDDRYPTVREFQAALQSWRSRGSGAERFSLEALFRGKGPKPGR